MKESAVREFVIEGSERHLNLLAHAQLVELDIGSDCGGHGICGKDRVWIPAEERAFYSPVTEIEQEHLGWQAIAEGWRLGCQCFPERSGLSLRIGYKER